VSIRALRRQEKDRVGDVVGLHRIGIVFSPVNAPRRRERVVSADREIESSRKASFWISAVSTESGHLVHGDAGVGELQRQL